MREAAAILADRPMRAVAKGTANMAKSVEIQIALADLEFLKANQYQLCFARMVNGAYTVVWQSYGGYLSNNPFSWLPLYQLFGTNTFTANGGEVTIDTNAVSIDLGEQAVLNPDGNMEPAVTGGPADGITMINQYGPIHPGLIGVSTGPDGVQRTLPMFVAPLAIATGTDVLTPAEKMRVWFQQNVASGTTTNQDISMAVELDLTAVDLARATYSQGNWSTT
jgi:hypothetical protein